MYAVLDGNESPLKAYIEFKKIEADLKEAIEAIKDQALEEASKYGKSFSHDGVQVEIRSSAGKWNYKHVQEWNELSKKMDSLEEQLKHAYKAKASLVNEGTGEILMTAQYTPGKETIFVTLNKQEIQK